MYVWHRKVCIILITLYYYICKFVVILKKHIHLIVRGNTIDNLSKQKLASVLVVQIISGLGVRLKSINICMFYIHVTNTHGNKFIIPVVIQLFLVFCWQLFTFGFFILSAGIFCLINDYLFTLTFFFSSFLHEFLSVQALKFIIISCANDQQHAYVHNVKARYFVVLKILVKMDDKKLIALKYSKFHEFRLWN